MHNKTLSLRSLASLPESSHTAYIHASDGSNANSTLCNCSSIPSPIYSPTHPSILLSIHLPAITHQPTCPAICSLIYAGIQYTIYPPTHCPSADSFIYPSIHPSTYPPTHLSIHPPIHSCLHMISHHPSPIDTTITP